MRPNHYVLDGLAMLLSVAALGVAAWVYISSRRYAMVARENAQRAQEDAERVIATEARVKAMLAQRRAQGGA